MKPVLIIAVLLNGLLLAFPGGAFATAPCPSLEGANIRFVVPHSVGGGYDSYSRLIASFYEEALNASIRVDNVEEAGGLVGASAIRDAPADGRTVGILNGPGLMIASLSGQQNVPNPATDFAILARVARSQHVWVTGHDSGLRSMADVRELTRARPLVFATRDVASVSFFSLVLGARFLDLPVEAVAGYPGSTEETLGLLRGDVDIMSVNFYSGIREIEAGDLRPLLQISDSPIADHPTLANVPLLGGGDGLAARWVRDAGRDPVDAAANTEALAVLAGAGRLIAAPLGMEEALRQCMENVLLGVLRDPEFVSAADRMRLSLDVAPGAGAIQGLRRGVAKSELFADAIGRAIEELRER